MFLMGQHHFDFSIRVVISQDIFYFTEGIVVIYSKFLFNGLLFFR